MHFNVSSDGESTQYSAYELVQLLLRNFTGKSRDDLDQLAETTALFLQRSESMHMASPFQLLHICFALL